MELVTITVTVLIVILFFLVICFLWCWIKRPLCLKKFVVVNEVGLNDLNNFRKKNQHGYIKSNSKEKLNKIQNLSDELNESIDGLNRFEHAVLEITSNKIEESVDSRETFYSVNNRRVSSYSTDTQYFEAFEQ